MSEHTPQVLFQTIFETHSKEIMRYAGLKLADREAAEDITASTFLRFWEKHLSGEPILNPRAFLYAIARGLIIDHYRRSGRRTAVSMESIDETFSTSLDVESLDDRINHRRILEKMHLLKDDYQEVILLHYVEGLTIPDIAEILSESENNVRVRVHRALEKLREQFLYEK